MSDVLVQVDGVSKKFCRDLKTSLWYGVKDIGRELTGRQLSQHLRQKEFWAVDDVSFQLRRGESLGIIGHNGAGKSTLLKMLCGIIKPNKGRIRMRGGVQALIELGAGFNPILTGRENIFIAAAIMGIPRAEVRKRFDQIVAFSELEDFIDTPLQSYSSGMKVRLGFAVAVNVEPDVLIIDEVLAVGDVKFRRKARNTMQELLDRDVALIFISHNIHEILGITQSTLWMDHGRVLKTGPSDKICADYTHAMTALDSVSGTGRRRLDKCSGELAIIEASSKLTRKGSLVDEDSALLILDMTYEAHDTLSERCFHAICVHTAQGTPVGYVIINDHFSATKRANPARRFTVDVTGLHPGQYVVEYELAVDGGPRLDGYFNLTQFSIPPFFPRKQPTDSMINWARMDSNHRGGYRLDVSLESRTDSQHAFDSVSQPDTRPTAIAAPPKENE